MESVKQIDRELGKRWGIGTFMTAFMLLLAIVGAYLVANLDRPGNLAFGLFYGGIGLIGSIVGLIVLLKEDGERIRRYRNAAVALEAKHDAAIDAIVDAIDTLADKNRVGRSKTARALRDSLVELILLKQLPTSDSRYAYCASLQRQAAASAPVVSS